MFGVSFKGGVHPPQMKVLSGESIKEAALPEKVVIPVSQHIGAPAVPIVKVGDYVKKYQLIAEADGIFSANIHSSISGTVADISETMQFTGKNGLSITINSDGKDEAIDLEKRDNWAFLKNTELVDIIKAAGIVGLGGAMFPTHVKLNVPDKYKVDTVIVNAAECEPFITADHRLMIESTKEILIGLKIVTKVLNAENIIMGIEDNKIDAAEKLKSIIFEEEESFEVKVLPTKYPQGAEKALVHAVLGKRVTCGEIPCCVGCVVINIATVKAVYDAVVEGKPLVERIATIGGTIKKPNNLKIRIGTLASDLIEKECGGYSSQPDQVIFGGPMMGVSLKTDEVPVTKGTNGIFVMKEFNPGKERACIKCGKCVNVCPMFLMPNALYKLGKKNKLGPVEEIFVMDCYECGSCSYVCPSKLPLADTIKKTKFKINLLRKKNAERAKK